MQRASLNPRNFSLTYHCDWQMPGEARNASTAKKARGCGIAAAMGYAWVPGTPANDDRIQADLQLPAKVGATYYTGGGYVRLAHSRA